MPITILGVDPGFASTGWAVVSIGDVSAPFLKDLGVIRTEKSDKKQNVLASNDNFRRARELSKEIRILFKQHQFDAVCAESMSFPRNASTAAKMAMCWGVIADICEELGTPMLMVTPKELKKAVCKNGSASKEEVQKAMEDMFGKRPKIILEQAGIPAGQHEHPYDALAAVVACLNSEPVRLLLKARRLDGNKMGEVGYDPGSAIG